MTNGIGITGIVRVGTGVVGAVERLALQRCLIAEVGVGAFCAGAAAADCARG